MDVFVRQLRNLIPDGTVDTHVLTEVLKSADPSFWNDERIQLVLASTPDPVPIEHLAKFLFEGASISGSGLSRVVLDTLPPEVCAGMLEVSHELAQEEQNLNSHFPLLLSARFGGKQQPGIWRELDVNFAGAVAALEAESLKPGEATEFLARHFAGLAGLTIVSEQDEDAMAAKRSILRKAETKQLSIEGNSTAKVPVMSGTYVDLPALRALLEADVALVKASYFLELAASGKKMPRRQDLPDSAIVGPKMLDRIFKELEALDKIRHHSITEMHFPGLVVVSYAWEAQEHPDADCQMLREVLAPAIEWYMSERAAYVKRKGFDGKGQASNDTLTGWSTVVDECGLDLLESIDFGIFVDYVSMYQKPRNPEQNEIFHRALNQMDILYAHQLTVKFRLTWRFDASGLAYVSRGWPFFETAVSAMISGSWHVLDLGLIDWTLPVEYYQRRWNGFTSEDFGEPVRLKFEGKMQPFEALVEQASYHYRNETVGIAGVLKNGRRPPLLPEAFATEVSSKTFTNNSDVESVIRMHARVCSEVLADVEVLSYNELGWGPFQAQDLAKVVLACPKLHSLELYKNPWGDRGVAALATALYAGTLSELRFLGLDCASVGDRGAIGIANLITGGKLPKLERLGLFAGCIGDEGFDALFHAVQLLPGRLNMFIDRNPDGPGKQRLVAWLHEHPKK